MRILLTNDDGIHARGLRALIEVFSGVHTVYVCAPDQERSAASHSATLAAPLRAKPLDMPGVARAWAVNGTVGIGLQDAAAIYKRPHGTFGGCGVLHTIGMVVAGA